MKLKRIMDATYNGEQPYDALYEILSGETPREVAYAFADCFGSQWVEEEYEFCDRELVADVGVELPPFDRSNYADSLADAYKELRDLDSIMAHLSADEIEELLDYYGYENDGNSDDDYYDDVTIYEEDQVTDSIHDTFEKVYDFPSWAVFYAMYGKGSYLTEEEKEMVDSFMEENGYTDLVDASEEITDFCRYPAFGEPTEVYDWVLFHKRKDAEISDS